MSSEAAFKQVADGDGSDAAVHPRGTCRPREVEEKPETVCVAIAAATAMRSRSCFDVHLILCPLLVSLKGSGTTVREPMGA